jgi:hypothetical protein
VLNRKLRWIGGLVGWALALAACPTEQCLRTNYAYSGHKTGRLRTKVLNASGGVESASESDLAATLAQDGGPPQNCWGPSALSGQVIAWIDVTGAEEGNCAADPSGVLCAPRNCDPRGSTPFEVNSPLTTLTVVLTDPDAGCP